MRQSLFVFFYGVVLIALQSILRSIFNPSLFAPNLVLPIVLYLAFFHKGSWGVLMSFILGLEYDVFASRELLGPNAGAFVVVYAAISTFSQKLFLESFVTVGLTTFFATLIAQAVYLIMVSQFITLGNSWELLIGTSLPEAISTALVSPLLFSIFKKIVPRRSGRALDRSRRSTLGSYQRVA